ncbi:MAG: redoxin domain-containing protein [Candidatus Omnitrophota bacterium]
MKKTACLLFLFAFVLALPALGAEIKKVNEMKIGDKAPDFKLPGADGRDYALKDFKDAAILVVIFTCNHCPTAQAYEERIIKIVADYKDKAVAFVAISPNDPKALRLDELGYTDLSDTLPEMKIRAEQRQFNFPYLFDGEKQDVSRAYGPTATPHVFIFDKERKLRYSGGVDNSEKVEKADAPYVRNALDALLAGKPVPEETTRRMGCSIKWSEKRDDVKKALERWAAEEVSIDSISTPQILELMKNDSPKLRLVNFWATWCPPCVVEFPDLVETNRMYRHRDFEMISISLNDIEDKEKSLSFLKKKEASSKNYILVDGEDPDKLIEGVGNGWEGSIPFTLLIRPGGEVVFKHLGAVDPVELRTAIVEILGRIYK